MVYSGLPSLRVGPNPLSQPVAYMTFGLEREEKVRLRVFDVQGRCMRELLNDVLPAGRHRIPWDGLSDNGHPVGSGIYFMQLKQGEKRTVRKLSVVR